MFLIPPVPYAAALYRAWAEYEYDAIPHPKKEANLSVNPLI